MTPRHFGTGPGLTWTVCGNTISNGATPAASGCNMVCAGDSSEYCGGGDRLNVYNYQDQYDPTATTTTSRTLP